MNLSGPVAGPIGLISTFFPLDGAGYVAEEFFLSGTAASHADDTAPYRVRVVVYRPADPARFTGTTVVEWLNVSSGADIPPFWLLTHRLALRSGWAWAFVSAQKAGIDGGGAFEEVPEDFESMLLPPLKRTAPERYATLEHPGDAYSYDIFSQAGRAVRDLLGAARLLAVGQSQSAALLVTYINEFEAQPYDGYIIDGRPGQPAGLEGFDGRVGAGTVRVRPRVPTFILQTETDVFGVLHSLPSRQDDSEHLRLWEIAGTAHADSYLINAAFTDSGALTADQLAAGLVAKQDPIGVRFAAPINSGPQHHYVAQAALAALDRWVRDGDAPPFADRLADRPDGTPDLDEYGIARGGIRTPWVDVPTAVLSGLGQGDTGPGVLFGSTIAFPPEVLAARHPDGREGYLAEFEAAAGKAVAAGFLLADDLAEILALAAAGFPS